MVYNNNNNNNNNMVRNGDARGVKISFNKFGKKYISGKISSWGKQKVGFGQGC